MGDVGEGAVVGFGAGVVSGLVGELGVFLVAQLAASDVWVLGFSLTWGVVLGVALGAVAGWRGFWPDVQRRAVVAAAPGFVAGAVAMALQWSAG